MQFFNPKKPKRTWETYQEKNREEIYLKSTEVGGSWEVFSRGREAEMQKVKRRNFGENSKTDNCRLLFGITVLVISMWMKIFLRLWVYIEFRGLDAKWETKLLLTLEYRYLAFQGMCFGEVQFLINFDFNPKWWKMAYLSI